jgi:leucyl-tRNA synthetase
MLAPICPHIAEELWAELGNEASIFDEARWPEIDEEAAKEDLITLAVQVNGKVRGTVEVSPGASEEEALSLARAEPNVTRYLEDAKLRRVIYVPDRLLNLVVG